MNKRFKIFLFLLTIAAFYASGCKKDSAPRYPPSEKYSDAMLGTECAECVLTEQMIQLGDTSTRLKIFDYGIEQDALNNSLSNATFVQNYDVYAFISFKSDGGGVFNCSVSRKTGELTLSTGNTEDALPSQSHLRHNVVKGCFDVVAKVKESLKTIVEIRDQKLPRSEYEMALQAKFPRINKKNDDSLLSMINMMERSEKKSGKK